MPHDPFALLDLPLRYDVDRRRVEEAYRHRVASLHPDRHAGAIAQAAAAEDAAALNAARAVLLDDERRAGALLDLLGGPAKEQDKSLPDGFLMEMMQRREAMDDALASGDPRQRQAMEDWAQQQRRQHRKAVAALFESADAPDDLAAIRRELNAWRYIERMIEQLDPAHEAP